jgi:IS5 family transposase
MDERQVARTLLHIDPALMAGRDRQRMMADKGYRPKELEEELARKGIALIRPATKKEPERPGKRFLEPFRRTTKLRPVWTD